MAKRMRAESQSVQRAARRLRCDPTPAEVALWVALRDRQLCGVRFRRQHAVGTFVLDFYSTAHRLAIEVDGDVHDQQQERDALRTEYLELRGIRVIRFRNEEVLHSLADVLTRIRAELRPPTSGQL
jgi:very-short-patch-repair endonuclease